MKKIAIVLFLFSLLSVGLLGQEIISPADGVPVEQSRHSDPQVQLGEQLALWSVIPFVLILLSIAIVPLVSSHWWESNLNKAVISFLLALPVMVYLIDLGPVGIETLSEVMHEYYAFIVLLLGLFIISGGIYLEGDLPATPLVNTAFLAIGAILASFIGTTGAAMVLIRPLIRTNRQRKNIRHIYVFFIFIVANIGGVLLPVGDPPLFLGYLYGVPFFWTLANLWHVWLTAVSLLLLVFFVWDNVAYRHETQKDLLKDHKQERHLRMHGKINLAYIAGVLLAVVFLRPVRLDSGHEIDLAWLQQPVIILLAVLSYSRDALEKQKAYAKGHFSHQSARDKNGFKFSAIIEVAVLFIGIFVTMIPAIALLKAHGAGLGVEEAWQFYWVTGLLSSFLDNAPTYATFFALGQSVTSDLLAAHPAIDVVLTDKGAVAAHLLEAVSVGAVFMGANTYIGNAPNFMVKAICEESKIKMPGFFGYMAYSLLVLIPVFFLIMLRFMF